MLKRLGIYSGLFTIIAVMFLLNRTEAFNSINVYLITFGIILIALLMALWKTFMIKQLHKISEEQEKDKIQSEAILKKDENDEEYI